MKSHQHLFSLMMAWKRRYGVQMRNKEMAMNDMAFATVRMIRTIGWKSGKEINEFISAIKKEAKMTEEKQPTEEFI